MSNQAATDHEQIYADKPWRPVTPAGWTPPAPKAPKAELSNRGLWNRLVVTAVLVLVFMSGRAALNWAACGADPVEAAAGTVVYGMPDSVQCIAIELRNP